MKNIEADPHVRVRVGRRWRSGTAHVLYDDDWRERQRQLPNKLNSATVRLMGTEHLTIRVDGSRQRGPELVQRLRELARDDPDLVRLALGDLRQHLQVLVGEQLRVGVAARGSRRTPSRSPSTGPRPRGSAPRARPRPAGSRDCFSPSAVRICDCLTPSAVRIAARRSRSARICFSIASWIEAGGSIAFSSTRLTRMPHLPVASSSTSRSSALIVVARGQRLLERHAADHVAQRRDGELLDRRRCSWRSRRSPPSGRSPGSR